MTKHENGVAPIAAAQRQSSTPGSMEIEIPIINVTKMRKRSFQPVNSAVDGQIQISKARYFDTEGNLLFVVTYRGKPPQLVPANWNVKGNS